MKNKSTLSFIILLIIIAILLGYNYFAKPFSIKKSSNFDQPQSEKQTNTVAEPQQNNSQKLSDQQKISQLLAVPFSINSAELDMENASQSAMLSWISTYQPGFVILFGQNITQGQAQKTISELKSNYQSELPLWLAVDHEGGKVQRLSGDGFTKLSAWQVMCRDTEEKMSNQLASSAAELKEIGVNVVLSPVVDVGKSASLNNRICSDQPTVVIKKAQIYLEAFSKHNILPVIKHFPGLGQTSQDLHSGFDQVTIGAEDAIIYRNLLGKQPRIGVMVAPVGVKNQYPEIPCVLSPDCVAELSNNFSQPLIFTDALEMKANFHVATGKVEPTLNQVAIQAIMSGNQVLVFGPSLKPEQLTELINKMVTEYQTNEDFKEKVDKALEKITDYKLGKNE